MENLIDNFSNRAASIVSMNALDPFSNVHMKPFLTMKRFGGVEIMYSPFDHIARHARLVIVGITPGKSRRSTRWLVPELSFRAADRPPRLSEPRSSPQALAELELGAIWFG
ncbi:hypothetical protein [Mesorhizobium sp. WSM3882]|uniref:hypothetical protein n=1 Tax=Mesorhizobium sp. WSM3882 TaxID=2029407 RepID=UPI00117D90C2|nr:hypothetical protein [Mesorhizobium sp. WSM3882]